MCELLPKTGPVLRSSVQRSEIGDEAASGFRLSAYDFRPVNLLVDGTENIFFIAEKTFFLTETMVSASDKIFCVTDTTVSVLETMVFANEKIFSMTATMFFVNEKIFSAIDKILLKAEKIFSVTITMVGDDCHPIDYLQVSGTPDFDYGVCRREDLLGHGKDLFNDRQDLFNDGKDLLEG